MSREIDQRDINAYVRFTLGREDLPPGANAADGGFIRQALAVAEFATNVLGASESQPIELVPDPAVQSTSSGSSTVHLQQTLHGIPVFQTSQTVQFSPLGDADRTQARLVAGKDLSEISIVVPSDRAVLVAARHLATPDADEPDVSAVDIEGYVPEVIAFFPGLPAFPTVYNAGPFADPITASLVWLPKGAALQLCWDITIAMPRFEGAFRTIVSVHNEEILFCTQLVASTSARGHVFRVDPDGPREVIEFPRPWASYRVPVPGNLAASPPDWVATDSTQGHCISAYRNETDQPSKGVLRDGVLVFDPANPVGAEQMIVNAFYGTCAMHDLTYLLGFREEQGSFQTGNGGVNGLPGQRVRVEICSESVFGEAHWKSTPSPVARFGPKRSTGRHTALDMTIVIHEYIHGVSNRLVGGQADATPLLEPQSRGMGEGWGDYFACALTGSPVFGGWAADDRSKGMRRFAYTTEFPIVDANFGIISELKTYEIGELWCATLLEMNRRIGMEQSLQLVIDGMKGLVSNPNLIDGRDGVLRALDAKRSAGQLSASDHATFRGEIWASFAKFGMGIGASSVGAGLFDCTADTSVP